VENNKLLYVKYLEVWKFKYREDRTNVETNLKENCHIDVNVPNFGFSCFKASVLELESLLILTTRY
jgi:hypothetical protein